MKLSSPLLLHAILVIVSQFSPLFADLDSEKQALLAFSDAVPHGPKLNWSNATDICTSWIGIICASNESHVSGIRLPSIRLAGPIPPNTLGKLTSLEVLSLRLNQLTGSLPSDVLSLPSLHHLFLQHNNFSGNIPASFPPKMNVLDLSFNSFTGEIPESIQNLTQLTRLNLRNNSLSGSIPNITFSRLKKLNISYNHLNGSVPPSFQNFPNSSFVGNSYLCGPPLNPCLPIPTPPPAAAATQKKSSKKLPLWGIIAIVFGGGIAIILFRIVHYCCYSRKKRRKRSRGRSRSQSRVRKGKSSLSQRSEKQREEFGNEVQEAESNKVVFIEGCLYSFDIEDLLQASAEVLGKGSFGTSYKASLEEESVTVVVKRLKDVVVGEKEFEQQVEAIGRVEPHPNVAPLRAYYYSKDEKLLIYDYISTGSLLNLLHGNRDASRTPLSWETRIKIALGTAQGMSHIHASNFIHGNIKSSNILITEHIHPCISDTALTPLTNPPPSTYRYTTGYRAPELLQTRTPSHKSDVYSYGVLLLEILTGKQPVQSPDLPRWVQSVVREEWTAEVFDAEVLESGDGEEEMVQMLQIGMACVVQVPGNRPTMDEVVKMIQEVLGSDSDDDNRSRISIGQSP